MMGALAGVALLVNAAAALVLLPHRTGDVNVRAVWLFSRNDAIGNMAVLIGRGARRAHCDTVARPHRRAACCRFVPSFIMVDHPCRAPWRARVARGDESRRSVNGLE